MFLFSANQQTILTYYSSWTIFIIHVLGCDEFYIPPDGGLDIRGFSAAATFVRGVFDKVQHKFTEYLSDKHQMMINPLLREFFFLTLTFFHLPDWH